MTIQSYFELPESVMSVNVFHGHNWILKKVLRQNTGGRKLISHVNKVYCSRNSVSISTEHEHPYDEI